MLVSYSQNAEDIRLWRVFREKAAGFYVDVGAGHPVRDSVTKSFYDAGWSGMNIEPGPLYAELAHARPRDINLELAVAAKEGEADFWVSSPDSGFSGFERLPDELVPEGFSFARRRIRCARLDALIAEHAPRRAIDFLKVDVEGAERDVLSSFDPETIRPTVILVESISPLENEPNHQLWESLLVEHGYLFAAFDGINRFYVPVEHEDLVDTLAYPISVLDRYEPAGTVSARSRAAELLDQMQRAEQEAETLRGDLSALREDLSALRGDLSAVREDVTRLGQDRSRLELENESLRASREQANAELGAIQATVSWRITRPLRTLRRAQLGRKRAAVTTSIQGVSIPLEGFVPRSRHDSESDPVFQVTGVAAAEILRRCTSLRAGETTSRARARTKWTVADFSAASDVDFVRAAHVTLLGRLPDKVAATRRALELEAGRSRLEILVRLALSPEGRQRRDQQVSGPALRSLVATGRAIEAVASAPVLGTIVRRVERLVRDDVRGRS